MDEVLAAIIQLYLYITLTFKVFKKFHRPHEKIKNVRTRVLASFRRRMGFLLNVKKALK